LSGETRSQISGWTVDTLKEYTERIVKDASDLLSHDIEHAKETASEAQINSQRAIDKADAAITKRFEGFNEFNQRMDKVTSDSLPRETATQVFNDLRERLDALTTRLNKREGQEAGSKETKQTSMAVVTAIILAAGAIGGVVGSWLKSAPMVQQQQQPQVIYIPAQPGTLIPSTPQQPAVR